MNWYNIFIFGKIELPIQIWLVIYPHPIIEMVFLLLF